MASYGFLWGLSNPTVIGRVVGWVVGWVDGYGETLGERFQGLEGIGVSVGRRRHRLRIAEFALGMPTSTATENRAILEDGDAFGAHCPTQQRGPNSASVP